MLDNLKLSLKQAIRSLLANRLYTLIVITMLTLGISCTTVIFSAVNSILLGHLPFAKANRVVFLWMTEPSNAVASQSNGTKALANGSGRREATTHRSSFM